MEEVYRYALVAGTVAKNHDFDVIHAHDWLTYSAGIIAKKISGKTANSTRTRLPNTTAEVSFNRKYLSCTDIEKRGMEAADRVVTVSNWTRQYCYRKIWYPC